METALHITNGDSAANLMLEGGIVGDILPWRDVLHDGPVPICGDLASLSEVRARFISDRGWADYSECLQSFAERDAMLANFPEYRTVCLWFEHDLYDQLQILQILDFLHHSHSDHRHVELICVDRYLGMMNVEQIAGLPSYAKAITPAQYALATIAWQAFCQPSPERWSALQGKDLSPLPFLKGAVIRMLEEYPAVGSGLGRTERQALQPLEAQPVSPAKLFANNQSCEERIFMGDASFWIILQDMMTGPQPLIQFEYGSRKISEENRWDPLHLTDHGRAVLHGDQDRMRLHYPERWVGGAHLNTKTRWRWDTNNSRILSL